MTTSRPAARLGTVIHGPEVVDSGSALRLIRLLGRFGQVRAVLGGTMGRLAVIDAGLEGLIEIGRRRMPSASVLELQAGSDAVVLLNEAKTRESGLSFGTSVAARAAASRPIKPLLQIDCGGRFVSELVCGAAGLGQEISNHLGFDFLACTSGCENDAGLSDADGGLSLEGDTTRRKLAGVLPGENISVNGLVVGKATNGRVEILAKDGRITEIRGATIKLHGIEKLPPLDLEKAIIRSGDIRRTQAVPRLLEPCGRGAVLIDHSAESAFEDAGEAALAITVGDDTTAIAGDILARLGVRVLGIVDGDLDNLSHQTQMPEGSLILKVRPGHDDIVGCRVKSVVFQGVSRIGCECGVEETIEAVIDLAGRDLISLYRF